MADTRARRGGERPEDLEREEAEVQGGIEAELGVSIEELAALFLLDTIRGFGPQKFKELYEAGVSPQHLLNEPDLLPTVGRRGLAFRSAIADLDGEAVRLARARAVRQLLRAYENGARVLTYRDRLYPPSVYKSNNPVPVLYVRGRPELLGEARAVACVGSRETSPPYSERHGEFAGRAAKRGFEVVSGFAMGADTIGHLAAIDAGGTTVLVMPCGLDRPFPPENRRLWDQLLAHPGAAMVSEFPFGTAAAGLTLRKRNKLIVAFAKGVLLSQSSAKGGAMNAYRFALEQHKPVATFAPDGLARSSGNQVIAESDGQVALEATRNGPATVFAADGPDLPAWDAWLQRLSSST